MLYTMTTIAELLDSIKNGISNIDLSQYEDILNPTSWSGASVESFIVVFLILFACYKLLHRAYKFVGWCLGLLVMIEICYLLGLSALNNYIPFSEIFKYDIGVSTANFLAGTPFASWILWGHDLFHVTIINIGNFVAEHAVNAYDQIDTFIRENPITTNEGPL